MAGELEVEEGVGAEIADLPDLELARPAADRRVGEAVERLRAGLAVLEAGEDEVLEHHDPLAQARQLRVLALEEAVDDQHAGHAGADLVLDEMVHVGVVPVQPLRVIGRDVDVVVELFLGRDPDEHAVAGRDRRDVHAVIVDVGGLGPVDVDLRLADLVDRLELDRVAALDAQGRRHVVAVDDVADDAAPADGHLGRSDRQRAGQDAVLADDLGRVGQVVDRGRLQDLVRVGGLRQAGRQSGRERHQDRQQGPRANRSQHRHVSLPSRPTELFCSFVA